VPTIVAISVSKVRSLGTPDAAEAMDRPWTTGFFKEPVVGAVAFSSRGAAGDEQADRINHGGPDKAVLAYSAEHYPAWQSELGLTALPFGAFGENLTVAGLTEADVCIGDRWRAGEVEFEVSQPRQPCWKLARRWRVKSLPAIVIQTGRTGWYLRVGKEGNLEAGAELELIDRPNPEWTIRRANEVMHFLKSAADSSLELAAVPGLSASWREGLRVRG